MSAPAPLAARATPHPAGHRIDLTWTEGADVVVVRRTGSYAESARPPTAADGVVLTVPADGAARLSDDGLRAGETYYYMVFEAGGGAPVRASATATAPHGAGAEMYDLLPALHRRFDAAQPGAPLRAFLELPGGQLDLLLSEADALRGLLDVARVDGALLPLLAEWIGWSIDREQDHAAQRTEIRLAPALYRTTGLIAAIEATVQRVTGRPGRVKELFQNVALTNRPPRLNLWTIARSGDGWGAPELLSLDGAFAGRAAFAAGSLFHEQEDHGRFAIWTKALGADGAWSPSEPVTGAGVLAKQPAAAALGRTDMVVFWSERDATTGRWAIGMLRRSPDGWAPAERVTLDDDPAELERRAPCAVADAAGAVWLLHLERTAAEAPWQLRVNLLDGTTWALPASVPAADGAAHADLAAAFHPTDPARPLWLFWAEPQPAADGSGTRWVVRFSIKAGADPSESGDWDDPVDVPRPAGDDEHEREPWPLVRPDGDVELYTSSFRGGRWGIWRRVIDHRTLAVGPPEPVPLAPRRARAPLAFAEGDTTILVARSSAGADARWAGTTTLHTRSADARPQRGTFDDAETYLHDGGCGADDLFARDTIGIYLGGAVDPAAQRRLRTVLDEVLPATDRAVLIEER